MIRRWWLVFVVLNLIAGLVIITGGCGKDEPSALRLVAPNGFYYKGEMSDTIPDSLLEFAVVDGNNNYIPAVQIQLEPVEGDGTLSHRSVTTDSTGYARFWYAFTGALGHAVVRLTIPTDTVIIELRANTLIPGVHGQGQYVLFDDTYADVRHFNGDPASIDEDPSYWRVYVNYEQALGVVVIVDDSNHDETANDAEQVEGVIVNTVYSKKTPEGIGIGSPIDSVRSAYGTPDTVWLYDDGNPANKAVAFDYNRLGMTFYCDTLDTIVEEIHLTEYVTGK